MRKYTDYTYARPSLVEGIMRIFDLGNTMNEYNGYDGSFTGKEADARAILSDWTTIGQDMYYAMGRFEKEEGLYRIYGELDE